MEDIYVKCCRCKNLHLHSERKEGRVDKRFGTRPLVCPRCGGHSYFKAEKPAQPPEKWGGLKMTDYANELRRHAVMRAAADRLDELERPVDAAIRARNEQIRSKIRPEFDCLYADTPGLFDLVTIEEFAARMGVSVADVRIDGAMRSSQDAESNPRKAQVEP